MDEAKKAAVIHAIMGVITEYGLTFEEAYNILEQLSKETYAAAFKGTFSSELVLIVQKHFEVE